MLAFAGLRGQENEGRVGKELGDFVTNHQEYCGMRLRQTT